MPKPTLQFLRARLTVDITTGRAYWIRPPANHRRLRGTEAGSMRPNHSGKLYCYIKVDRVAIKRSHIVFLFAAGRWPSNQIDHRNGDSTDDRIANLREATPMQNAWNHKRRSKKERTPMGVRRLPSGRYQARIAVNHTKHTFGPFDTEHEASAVYQQKRKEFFGDYS